MFLAGALTPIPLCPSVLMTAAPLGRFIAPRPDKPVPRCSPPCYPQPTKDVPGRPVCLILKNFAGVAVEF